MAGDGAYDKDKVRKELYKKGIRQLIPPQHNAVLDTRGREHMAERDKAIKLIEAKGRNKWKEKEGYHQRSKAETVMFKYKTIIGESLAARKLSIKKQR